MNAAHLYVHVPFCARRCTYCDFSIAVRKRVPVAEFLGGLARELNHTGTPDGLRTVYLGGGTPSKLGGEGIAKLAGLLGRPSGLAEFTIEANPEDVTADAVAAWAGAGVSRISLGAQSFDNNALVWMHRTHGRNAIGRAVETARAGGIGNISIDLIFWLPEALQRNWRRDLEAALALEPDHISLYGLTVEEGTPLGRQVARGQTAVATDARYEEEYLLAHELLAAAGLAFYEVSNAARPGREAVHNRAYWKLTPYLGVGPSAHSFDGVARWWNESAYAKWLERLEAGASPVGGREILAERQQALERLYLGLRTAEGVEFPEPLEPKLREAVSRWVNVGWAVVEAREGVTEPGLHACTPARLHVRLTPLGWLRLDQLVASV